MWNIRTVVHLKNKNNKTNPSNMCALNTARCFLPGGHGGAVVRPRPAVWIQLSRQGRVATSRPGGVEEGGERRAISHKMSGPSIGELWGCQWTPGRSSRARLLIVNRGGYRGRIAPPVTKAGMRGTMAHRQADVLKQLGVSAF